MRPNGQEISIQRNEQKKGQVPVPFFEQSSFWSILEITWNHDRKRNCHFYIAPIDFPMRQKCNIRTGKRCSPRLNLLDYHFWFIRLNHKIRMRSCGFCTRGVLNNLNLYFVEITFPEKKLESRNFCLFQASKFQKLRYSFPKLGQIYQIITNSKLKSRFRRKTARKNTN